jgi:hypothetical protein
MKEPSSVQLGFFDKSPAEARQRAFEAVYRAKLRRKVPGLIRSAKERAATDEAKGKPSVAVELTVDQVMTKLAANNYRCALSGNQFWDDDGGSYGPTCPSLDRLVHKGPYDDENTRVVLLGINSLRGEGSDEDVYRLAEALCRHRLVNATKAARIDAARRYLVDHR